MAQEKKLTQEKILEALEECRKDPAIPAACVADKLGASSRYMTEQLTKLVDEGVLVVEKRGNTLYFKPV